MKIAMISYNDWGGTAYLLAQGINKYTNHTARSITEMQHPFLYDTDLVVSECIKNGTEQEIHDIVDESDFYIISQQIPPFLYKTFPQKIKRNNMLMLYGGSDIRSPANTIFDMQLQGRYFWSCTAYDFTATRCLIQSIQFGNHIVDTDKWKPKEFNADGPIRIYHSPTNNTLKGTIHISDAIERLKTKYEIEWTHTGCTPNGVGGLPWQTVMKEKSKSDIFIDAVALEMHGQNTVEVMSFGVPVINYLGDYYMSIYPDTPIVNANKDNIYNVLKNLLSNPGERNRIGKETRDYCIRTFGVETRTKMMVNLIEFINNPQVETKILPPEYWAKAL